MLAVVTRKCYLLHVDVPLKLIHVSDLDLISCTEFLWA